MKKLFKLLGVGLLSGAACRMGSMLADAFFPKGLGGFLARFRARNEDQTDKDETICS